MATDTLLRSTPENTGGGQFPGAGKLVGVCTAMHTLFTRTVEKRDVTGLFADAVKKSDGRDAGHPFYWRR